MDPNSASIIQIIFAIILIVTGLFGLVLPIIPGIVLLVAGVVLLNKHANIPFLKDIELTMRRSIRNGLDAYRKRRIARKKEKLKKIEQKIRRIEQKLKRTARKKY